MQYPSSSTRWTALAALLLLSACPETDPSVTYTGQDAGEAEPGGAGSAAHGGSEAVAGRAGAAGSTGGAGSAGRANTAGVSGSAGGAGAAGAAGTGAADSTTVSFAVTTMPVGGKYQPKNIGAIWVETPGGEFVKTLELWAKTRRRYLTKFNRSVGTSGAVDVTASATLLKHKAHQVIWNHRDRNAADRSPGPYRLCVEVTDADATGQNYCLDFDSSTGTETLTPADQKYFKALSLSVR